MSAPDLSDAGPAARAAAAPVRALIRGLTLLEIVAASPHGAGSSDVARAAGLDRATTARLLTTLRQQGYVRQRPSDRRYLLNGKVLSLARSYEDQLDLRDAALPHLTALRDLTRETVHLAVREGRQVVYVDQLEPDRTVRASAEGSRLPLHVTAMGRAILAVLPEREREELLRQLLADPNFSDYTVDLDQIGEELARTNERGWATVERDDDVCRIGVAILDATGRPVGAISVSGPRYRMEKHQLECAEAAMQTAAAISVELGA